MRALLRYLFRGHQRDVRQASSLSRIPAKGDSSIHRQAGSLSDIFRGGLQMFHLTRLLHSHRAWSRNHAVRACVFALGLACAVALYFLSPLSRRAVIAQTGPIAL